MGVDNTIKFRPRASSISGASSDRARRDARRTGRGAPRGSATRAATRGVTHRTSVAREGMGRGSKTPRLPRPSDLTPRVRRRLLAVAAVTLVLLLVFYAPLCSLYAAHRTQGLYAAQLTSLSKTNSELTAEKDRLLTEEGIREEARKLGYTDAATTDEAAGADDAAATTDGSAATTGFAATGDSAADSQDDSDTTTTAAVGNSLDQADAAAREAIDNSPWYVRVLDFILRYDPVAQGVLSGDGAS